MSRKQLIILALLAVLATGKLIHSFVHAPLTGNISPFIEFIKDDSNSLNWKTVTAQAALLPWQRTNVQQFSGERHSRYWFRLNLEQLPTQITDEAVLLFATQPSLIDQLSLDIRHPTEASAQTSTKRFTTGSSQPYLSRDIDFKQYAFHLPAGSYGTSIIGYIDNSQRSIPFSMPVYLMNMEAFSYYRKLSDFASAAFYGLMIALFIYNFSLFVMLKQIPYGFYVAFLSTVMLICAIADGTALEWLWPNTPLVSSRTGAIAEVIGSMLFNCFVFTALSGLKFWPRYRTILYFMLTLGAAALIIVSISHYYGLSRLYAASIALTSTIALVAAVRQNYPSAAFLLLAEAMVVIGGVSWLMFVEGLISANLLSQWSLHAGFALEALLLSLMLGSRTRLSQQSSQDNLKAYEDLFETSSDGLFKLSASNDTVMCNGSLAKLFKINIETGILTLPLSQLPELAHAIDELKNNNDHNLIRKEIEIVTCGSTTAATSESRWALLSVNTHQVTGLISGSMVNITDQKQREFTKRALLDAQQQIISAQESSIEVTNAFLSTISHELRTPMNAILVVYKQLRTITSPQQQKP